MPISPRYRWLYPIDWPELSRHIRFIRAGGRCEHCDRPHGEMIIHLGDGIWWDPALACWRDGRGRPLKEVPQNRARRSTRVILACAHLDHDPTHNHDRNLAALCQRCHMIHDAAEHRRRRWLNAFQSRARGDLFLGPYPYVTASKPARRAHHVTRMRDQIRRPDHPILSRHIAGLSHLSGAVVQPRGGARMHPVSSVNIAEQACDQRHNRVELRRGNGRG